MNQVDVTPISRTRTFSSVFLGKDSQAAVMEKLEEHRRDFAGELAKHVVLKYTPHLVFHLDDSIERGTRVIKILQEIEEPEKSEE